MATFLQKNFPGLVQFLRSFFNAMDNRTEGHSLRKWLAVGFFWLTSVLCLRFTDKDNLVIIIGILTGMIVTLVITYSVTNLKDKKLDAQTPGSQEDVKS